MKLKQSWGWFFVAGVLLAFILIVQPHLRRRALAVHHILPSLEASAVTSIHLTPQGKSEIRVEHTDNGWLLTQPVSWPARNAAIDQLLALLQTLTPAAYIPRHELKSSATAEQDFGFASPVATLWIWQGDYRLHLFVGSRTPPGDQVYFQVAGDDGIYVVDALLLRFLPGDADAWRDREIFHLQAFDIDRVAVTNGGKAYELQRAGTNALWQIVTPGSHVRGDNEQISSLVSNLQYLTINKFVSDATNADLDAFGLVTPSLQLSASAGTNQPGSLLVGKVPTNDESQCYARLPSRAGVFTVAKAAVEPWRKANELRDTHLFTLVSAPTTIEVRGRDDFSLVNSNGLWRFFSNSIHSAPGAAPPGFPADATLVSDLLSNLMSLEIVQFVKDVVTEPDLPAYGLATPSVQYTFRLSSPNTSAGPANFFVAFGTNQEDKVFCRRSDESAVYAVPASLATNLPRSSWQFRDRRVWDFSEDDVASVEIVQNGMHRELVRNKQYEWTLATNSSGVIEPLAIEETVRPLCHLNAAYWVACGETNRAQFGLTNTNYKITLQTKKGGSFAIEFGATSPSSFPYAGTKLDGEFWVFELPLRLSRDVVMYLSIPRS